MFARIALTLVVAVLPLLPWQAVAEAVPPAAAVESPLAPADTTSPRGTLFGFIQNVTNALHAWQTGASLETTKHHAQLAVDAFDFSHLPHEIRLARELETALFLKEILDRITLPPTDEIPGAEAVGDDGTAITHWTIPGTSITIARMPDGPRAGEFLFTTKTVDQLPNLYKRARQLPYRPGATVGILEEFLHTPGIIVPHAWATAIPTWSRAIVLDRAIWQWLTLAAVLIGGWLILRLLLACGRWWDSRYRGVSASRRFGTPLAILAGTGVLYLACIVLVYGARFQGEGWNVVPSALLILIFAGFGWFIALVTGRIADAINEARKVKEGSIDSQLVRVLMRLLSLVFLVVLGLYAADTF